MGLFKKKNNNNDDYNYDYMEDSDAYGFKYSSKDDYNEYQDSNINDYYEQGYNNNSYNAYNGINPYDKEVKRQNKKENKYKNKYVNKSRKYAKKKDTLDYGYSTGYDDEQVYYDENGVEILNQKKIDIKTVAIRTFLFFYLIYILVGALGTTFSDGYKAQIVSATTRGQRITYSKCMSQVDFLDQLDDFKGVSELKELYKTGDYLARIAPLKDSLSKVDTKVSDLTSAEYKVDQSDYVDVEMMNMVSDLMSSEQKTLKAAITYYQSISGSSSSTQDLESAQSALLEQQQVYKNKLSTYKMRFQQIKTYELKLEK